MLGMVLETLTERPFEATDLLVPEPSASDICDCRFRAYINRQLGLYIATKSSLTLKVSIMEIPSFSDAESSTSVSSLSDRASR